MVDEFGSRFGHVQSFEPFNPKVSIRETHHFQRKISVSKEEVETFKVDEADRRLLLHLL